MSVDREIWRLAGLWLAIGAFMIARLVALTARARTHAWAVTGARR